MQPGRVDPWQPARGGLRMVFFAWLVNACMGLLVSTAFTAILSMSHSGMGTDGDWKLLDRLSLSASFVDVAAMVTIAVGMALLARAPAPASPGGPAMGAFACALVSAAIGFWGFLEQMLQNARVLDDPVIGWRTMRYVYAIEAAAFIAAVILFVIAGLEIAGALRAPDASWKGLVAMIAIPLVTLVSTTAMFVQPLGRFRMDHRWSWFLIHRGIRGLGDVMLLLFVAELIRRSRLRS